jgi:hypothetical protein
MSRNCRTAPAAGLPRHPNPQQRFMVQYPSRELNALAPDARAYRDAGQTTILSDGRVGYPTAPREPMVQKSTDIACQNHRRLSCLPPCCEGMSKTIPHDQIRVRMGRVARAGNRGPKPRNSKASSGFKPNLEMIL